MNNVEINDIVIAFRKELEEQIIVEYGEEALLEDRKYFTKQEVCDILDILLRKKEGLKNG